MSVEEDDAILVMPRARSSPRLEAPALQQDLERRLADLPVEIETLSSLGAWTVRGPKSALDVLRAADGPLADAPFEVVPEANFYEGSSRPLE